MFAYPLGLLALLAVPAVVALHLFRRRFEPRVISALFLWAADDRVALAGRRRERLIQSPSLWLELAACVLLALAFAGPRAGCAATRAQHLVVVLDSSASMGAVVAGASTDAKARELVRERIEALSQGSRVTLVKSGARPSVLAGPAAFPTEALERLDVWRPAAAHHDLNSALALALQLAGDAAVLVVTDHFAPDEWPAEVELASVGEPVDNLAITHAARTRSRDTPDVDDVFVGISSFAGVSRVCRVRVATSSQTIAEREVELDARGRAHVAFELPASTPAIEVRIDADALAVDDVVMLCSPPRRTLALATNLDLETAAALGLSRTPGGLERWLATVPDARAASSLETAHLALTRGIAGGAGTWVWSFAELGAERKDLIGPFFAEKRDPLLAGVTLEGLVWSADPALVLPGVPLISAGNQPLLTEEQRGDRTLWQVNFDPLRSSLQRSPDWPLLLANMAELRRAALPGPVRTSLVAGQPFEYRPGVEVERAEGAREYELIGPCALDGSGGATRNLPALARVVIDDLELAGLYRLSFRGARVAEFALSFVDAAESDLSGQRPGRRAAQSAASEIDVGLSWIEIALLFATLTLVALDWWVLARATRKFGAS